MQPYFFPYIGYFQLIDAADILVLQDLSKFTKRGWINRNKYCLNGDTQTFSLNVVRAPDHTAIREKLVSPVFNPEALMRRLEAAYGRRPGWLKHKDEIAALLRYPNHKLGDYLANSIAGICSILDLRTRILMASDFFPKGVPPATDGVIEIVKSLGGSAYLNLPGGRRLYDSRVFGKRGIRLGFLEPNQSSLGGEPLSILHDLFALEENDVISKLLSYRLDWNHHPKSGKTS